LVRKRFGGRRGHSAAEDLTALALLLERAESAFVEGEARGAEDRHSIGSSSLRAGNDEAQAPPLIGYSRASVRPAIRRGTGLNAV